MWVWWDGDVDGTTVLLLTEARSQKWNMIFSLEISPARLDRLFLSKHVFHVPAFASPWAMWSAGELVEKE